MERSIHSARHCFVENLHKNGLMTDAEHSVLAKWYDHINLTRPVHPDVILYLRTTPDTVFSRIRKRDRPEERSVPKEYLEQLHELHEDWLLNRCPYKVVTIDGNRSLEEVEKQFLEVRGSIFEKHGDLINPNRASAEIS